MPKREEEPAAAAAANLPVSLGHTLDLVLLLDGVRVGRSAGGVDDLIGEALGDGLDVAERRLARSGGDQVESLSTQRQSKVEKTTTHNT